MCCTVGMLPSFNTAPCICAACCTTRPCARPPAGPRRHPLRAQGNLLHPLPVPRSLQSLVASNLGKDDRRSAAAVFRRTLTLAVSAGVVRLLDACKGACFVIYWHALFISPACPVSGLSFQV